MEKLGGSISFQLIDIFNIIESGISEEEKRTKIKEYQESLTQEGKGIRIGERGKNDQCMTDGFFVFGNIIDMSYEDLVAVKKYVDNNLSSLTCEAEMKMSPLLEKFNQNVDGIKGYDSKNKCIRFSFDNADKVYQYAMSHGKGMRGHTIIWDKHFPKEVLEAYITDHYNDGYEGNIESDNTNQFKARRKFLTKQFLKEYMIAVFKQYPKCYCWDILNEIVPQLETGRPTPEERTDNLKHSGWFEYLGDDFYITVLETARKAAKEAGLGENVKFFYNECGEEHPEKRAGIIQIIEKIKEYEQQTGQILLDGIGLQSHYDLTMTREQIEEIYRDFATTGKEIQVTEMDIASGKDENGKPKNWRRRRYVI